MKNNLENLIPEPILNCLKLDLIDIELELTARPAQGRWPCVCIQVDGNTVYQGPVIDQQKFKYSARSQSTQEKCTIEIVFYNKDNYDTVVDQSGHIIENQCLSIVSVVVNGVDLVKTNIIHSGIGYYTMHLNSDKYQYFLSHNINVNPTTSLDMAENGIWRIELGLPILSFITGLHNVSESWGHAQVDQLLNTLYQQYQICKDLEQGNDISR